MPASNIPGWQLGYRFNAANYSGGQFVDLTGNGNSMTVVTGSPVFETVDTHEGVKLDNTWNARFWHPNAWQGTVLAVLRTERLASGTLVRYMVDFDRTSGTGNSGRMLVSFVGSDHRLQLVSTSSRNAGPAVRVAAINVGALGPVAWTMDQQRQNTYATLDGSTIVSGTADTGTTTGNLFSMGSDVNGAHIGALTGDITNTTPDTTVNIHIFELHFFEANPQLDAATELQAFMAELSSSYS